MYTVDKLKPYPPTDYNKKWTVTGDLTSLETFENSDSNYDVRDKLIENNVLDKRTDEDSESCQFYAYFSTKKSAENFLKRLAKYVEKRKKLIKSL